MKLVTIYKISLTILPAEEFAAWPMNGVLSNHTKHVSKFRSWLGIRCTEVPENQSSYEKYFSETTCLSETKSVIDSLAPERRGCNRKLLICTFISRIDILKTLHWLGSWFGAVRQQAITWTNVDPVMMTSLNGNIFRVTGPLWGDSTGHRWIPLTKASDAELWCFLWSAPEQKVEQTLEIQVIWDATALIMTSL